MLVSGGTSLKNPKAERVDKLRVIWTRSLKASTNIDAFSNALWPFITHVKDNAAEGKCGFRTIAGLMGLAKDSWH